VSQTELTPLSYLRRSAEVYPEKTAIIYGDRRYSYARFAELAAQLARALRASGIHPGDRVAYLLPNLPEMLVAHFAVPLSGAVLVAINTRLSTDEVRYILDHSGAKLLVVDSVLAATVAPVRSWGSLRRAFIGIGPQLVGVVTEIEIELPIARQIHATGRRGIQPVSRAPRDPKRDERTDHCFAQYGRLNRSHHHFPC